MNLNRKIENSGHDIPFWNTCKYCKYSKMEKEGRGGERGGIGKTPVFEAVSFFALVAAQQLQAQSFLFCLFIYFFLFSVGAI
jgi:hypothetical protein